MYTERPRPLCVIRAVCLLAPDSHRGLDLLAQGNVQFTQLTLIDLARSPAPSPGHAYGRNPRSRGHS